MPDKKQKKSSKVDQRIRELNREVGLLWILASIISGLGALLLIVGAATTSWITVPAYTVRFIQNTLAVKDTAQTKAYQPSYYGLFMINFNEGGAMSPWYQKASRICNGYNLLAQQSTTSGITNLWDGTCTMDCVSHFKQRCSYYTLLSNTGFMVLAAFLIVIAATVTSIAWMFLVGKSASFMLLSWLGGGLITLLCCLAYLYVAHFTEKSLNFTSMYPPMKLGYSFYLSLVAALMLTTAGVLAAVGAYMDKQEVKKMKEEAIIKKEARGVAFNVRGGPPGANRPAFLPPPGRR